MGMFYADDGLFESRDSEWIQVEINALIRLFQRFVVMNNIAKSNTMTCQPGTIQTGTSKEAFSRMITEKAATYLKRLLRHIPYPYYGL